MTDLSLAAGPGGIKIERHTASHVVFINWPVADDKVMSCNLFDDTDYSDCTIAFFDPLEFAISNDFISSDDNISEVKYLSFDEKDFFHYLSRVKRASEILQNFLAKGGLLVIRSNIPKLYIKVHKQSLAGTMGYTESVISVFFWLEDIAGTYSLTYCQDTTLKYIIPRSPLEKVFGKSAVQCVQTVNSVSKGKLEVIACRGASIRAAAISRISFDSIPGQIYFIPKFIVSQEHKKLIDAFEQTSINRQSESLKPSWLDFYEKQTYDLSPYRSQINQVELEMEALQKQMAILQRNQKKYDDLTTLLSGQGLELETAARTALGILGFTCVQSSQDMEAGVFAAYPANDKTVYILVKVSSTEAGPVPSNDVGILADIVNTRTSSIPVKGLLIGNSSRHDEPEQRTLWFEDEAVEISKRWEFCLMPTLALFTLICFIISKQDSKNIEKLKNSLRQEIIKSDSVFVINRGKYGL